MFSPKDHPLFKEPKVYHWCHYHLTWTVHREDKFEKGKKVSKMDEAQKEKRGERTSTRPTMHSYVHLQVRILMSFSFRRQWFKGRSKYEEADDGYCSMNSNTLEWLDWMYWVSQAIAILVIAHCKDGVILHSYFLHNDGCHGSPMMMTGLVRVLEWIFQPLLRSIRGRNQIKSCFKNENKKKMLFKSMYNVNKSRWVHRKGNCTPRYLLPASVLKKRCLCRSKKGSIIL